MKKLLILVALAGFLLVTSLAHADSITGSSGADWITWAPADLNEDGSHYWDGASWDGSEKNIGYYLTNSGGFSSSTSGPGAIPYWGISAAMGGYDPNFYFESAWDSNIAAIQIEIAGFADSNIFGWYDVGDPENLIPLFAGSAGAGESVTFTPSASYGYYLTSPDGTFYTQSINNNQDSTFQHFAVFREGGDGDFAYWIGVEDLLSSDCDFDYNDFVVKVSAAPVPEPATMLLLGSGLIGLAALGRKKFLKKS